MSFTSTLTLIGAAGAAEDIYFAYTVTDPGGITRLTLQAVHVDSSNNIYAAGLARPGGTNVDADNRLYVIKLDKNGNKQWDNLYYVGLTDPTTVAFWCTRPGGLTTDSDGNVFVVVNAYNDFGQTVVKISADGSTIENVIADSDISATDNSRAQPGNIQIDSSGVVYSVAKGASSARVKTFANDLSSCTAGYRIGADTVPEAGRFTGFGTSGDDIHWFSKVEGQNYWMLNEYDFSSNTYSSGDFLERVTGLFPYIDNTEVDQTARCGSISPDYGNYKSYLYVEQNGNNAGYQGRNLIFTRYEYRDVNAVGSIYPTNEDNDDVVAFDCLSYLTSSMVVGGYKPSAFIHYGLAFRHSTASIFQPIAFDHLDFRSASNAQTRAVALDADLTNRTMAVIGLDRGTDNNNREDGGFCIVKLPFSWNAADIAGTYGDLIISDYTSNVGLSSGTMSLTDTYTPTTTADTSASGSFATQTVTAVTYTETLDEIEVV